MFMKMRPVGSRIIDFWVNEVDESYGAMVLVFVDLTFRLNWHYSWCIWLRALETFGDTIAFGEIM
jgi:hypothetical protein